MQRPGPHAPVTFDLARRRRYAALLLTLLLSFPLRLPCAGQEATPAPRILSLEFEGNKAIDDTTLRSVFRRAGGGGVYRPEWLRSGLRLLEERYRDQGYMRASAGEVSVDRVRREGGEEAVAVRIAISEGPLYTLGSLQIRNAVSLSRETLMQMAPLRAGQPYSRRRLEEWRDKITESYLSMGYIRFRGELTEEVDEVRHTVAAVLDCSEGAVYRVRKIVIAGDGTVDATEFRKKILVGEGGVYNPEMLALTVQFLNQMGAYKPLSGSDVELKIDDQAGAVDIVFRVSLRRPPSQLR